MHEICLTVAAKVVTVTHEVGTKMAAVLIELQSTVPPARAYRGVDALYLLRGEGEAPTVDVV